MFLVVVVPIPIVSILFPLVVMHHVVKRGVEAGMKRYVTHQQLTDVIEAGVYNAFRRYNAEMAARKNGKVATGITRQ